ncbi:Auxin_inducible domain-containing protein [Cephalotus follicularis]|uniref:Auxin_inducible domain-containing protein n=1 Tax=Cephalotus follicularis TaxID=3775 RepID=A0A1Q3C3P9_CEPFO|nr:Auxin_inducible domain-containing protein [Cephalotus follicularis]
MNLILRKCKSLSRQLGSSSSYSSLRTKSTRDNIWGGDMQESGQDYETIYVGSTRKRYVISSKYLNHPLLNALVERSSSTQKHGEDHIMVKCEIVLFDHLLWMLETSDPNLILGSLVELAELYVF